MQVQRLHEQPARPREVALLERSFAQTTQGERDAPLVVHLAKQDQTLLQPGARLRRTTQLEQHTREWVERVGRAPAVARRAETGDTLLAGGQRRLECPLHQQRDGHDQQWERQKLALAERLPRGETLPELLLRAGVVSLAERERPSAAAGLGPRPLPGDDVWRRPVWRRHGERPLQPDAPFAQIASTVPEPPERHAQVQQ